MPSDRSLNRSRRTPRCLVGSSWATHAIPVVWLQAGRQLLRLFGEHLRNLLTMQDQILIDIPVAHTHQNIKNRGSSMQMGGTHEVDRVTQTFVGLGQDVGGQRIQHLVSVGRRGRALPPAR